MAKEGPRGKGRRGMVKGRSQLLNKKTGLWIKRIASLGIFADNKTTGGKFKGVRAEK